MFMLTRLSQLFEQASQRGWRVWRRKLGHCTRSCKADRASEPGRTGTAAAAAPPSAAAATAAPAGGARPRPFFRLSPRAPDVSMFRLRHLSCTNGAPCQVGAEDKCLAWHSKDTMGRWYLLTMVLLEK